MNHGTGTGKCVRAWLMEGAIHPSPVFEEEWADRFDSHPSWSPAPRIDAAAGLLFLALKSSFVDSEIIEAIEKLSLDPVPVVRFHIADHLGALALTSPQTMRKLLSEMLEKDPSSSVIHSLINRPLRQLLSPVI